MTNLQIHHVSMIVSDTQRALGFYCDVLGLKTLERRANLTFPGAWLDIGGQQQIHLLEVPNPDSGTNRPKYGGRDRHLALSVDNFEVIQSRLDALNIPYQLSSSGRQALFCCDPDSNAIELLSRTSVT